tara:strand:+ start:275 stop:457 length:183 start_codon:yes stop_codon:yes gene_type:complete
MKDWHRLIAFNLAKIELDKEDDYKNYINDVLKSLPKDKDRLIVKDLITNVKNYLSRDLIQ